MAVYAHKCPIHCHGKGMKGRFALCSLHLVAAYCVLIISKMLGSELCCHCSVLIVSVLNTRCQRSACSAVGRDHSQSRWATRVMTSTKGGGSHTSSTTSRTSARMFCTAQYHQYRRRRFYVLRFQFWPKWKYKNMCHLNGFVRRDRLTALVLVMNDWVGIHCLDLWWIILFLFSVLKSV